VPLSAHHFDALLASVFDDDAVGENKALLLGP